MNTDEHGFFNIREGGCRGRSLRVSRERQFGGNGRQINPVHISPVCRKLINDGPRLGAAFIMSIAGSPQRKTEIASGGNSDDV
jgi:hypothetical protein